MIVIISHLDLLTMAWCLLMSFEAVFVTTSHLAGIAVEGLISNPISMDGFECNSLLLVVFALLFTIFRSWVGTQLPLILYTKLTILLSGSSGHCFELFSIQIELVMNRF